MDEAPWRSEHALTEREVGELLRRQFPGLPAREVAYLAEGWDSRAFLVDGSWIFRFPKRREVAVALAGERRVLDRLDRMALPVRVPRLEFVGAPSESYPLPFVGYRMIAGTPADRFDPGAIHRETCADQLASFLGAVHAIAEGAPEVDGLPVDDGDPRGVLEQVAELRDAIRPGLPADLSDACGPYLDGSVPVPPPAPGRCLVHNDLLPEHILLDEDGSIAGVIDWGDAALGDPAVDFVGIGAWLDDGFVDRVLDAYPRPMDAGFRDRVRFRARCVALANYGWAMRGWQVEPAVALRMVRTAFGL